MKRENLLKGVILILSLFSIIFAFSNTDFGHSRLYEESLISEEAYMEIIAAREETTELTVPELRFNNYPIYFDSLTSTFLYSLIDDNDSSFNPKIHSVSETFSQYEIAIAGDILNEESIASNNQATLIVYDDNYYKEFSLAATTLPIISVSMNEKTEDRDNPIGALDQRAQFELFDNRAEASSNNRVLNSQTYIRLRGASSLRFPKKQFRVKLREFSISGDESNQNLPLLGLRNDDDWILNSPYNDPEKMRNTLSSNLWSDVMGENNPVDIKTGTEAKFVELFIDGKYWGIYSLLHPIDAKQLDLTRNNTPQSDYYYRSFSHTAFNKDDFMNFNHSYTRGRFELRDPEPNGHAFQWEPLVKHLESLDYNHSEMLDYIEQYAYMPNLIDYYLFYILLQATDNDTKNHNYIAKYHDGYHTIIESPWDLDLTWGLRWNQDHPIRSTADREATHNSQPESSHITRAIRDGNDEIIELVTNRYRELRETDWSEESLMNRIDDLESDIYLSGASLRDVSRWPTSAYHSDISIFRTFILERLSSMDNYLDDILGGEHIE